MGVRTVDLKPDWVVVILPVALQLRLFNLNGSLVVLALLVAVAFVRKRRDTFAVNTGPMLLMIAACGIILFQTDGYYLQSITILICILMLRLIRTVDARRLIASLIDGWALYIFANALGDALGLRSPKMEERVGNLIETTGFVRTVFPLASSLNAPAIVAGAYLVAVVCLYREIGSLRRIIWLICGAAAIIIEVKSGTRTAIVFTLILSVGAIFMPSISRWLATAATLFAAVSAFILPRLLRSAEFIVAPLSALSPGRAADTTSVTSLQGREYIWQNAIRYWNEQINAIPDVLLGYGEMGHYKSGASLTYTYVVRGIGGHPEYAGAHNSFLQQLFDGGVLGLALMVLATLWASIRLASRRRQWDRWAVGAIFAMTTIILGSTTEATMAPGVFQESFLALFFFIAVACQAASRKTDHHAALGLVAESHANNGSPTAPVAANSHNGRPNAVI